MKRQTKIILGLALLLSITACKSGDEESNETKMPYYPKYNQVVDKLLEEYSLEDIDESHFLGLIKKPKGWYIKEYSYETGEDGKSEETIRQEQLFWSSKKKHFKKLDYPAATGTENESYRARQMLKAAYVYDFDNVPYYGYDDWYKDIVDRYASDGNLSDTMLNAMGRAYGAYATGVLPKQYELPGKNTLSPQQLTKYRKYMHKSLDYFRQVMKINPDFESIVGIANNKYSNEHVHAFMTLLQFHNRTEAMKELKKGLYDEFVIGIAEKYLNSCDSNAILFTHGDNDTYPLLYLQEILGVRKDVSVINTALLYDPRYLSILQHENFVNNPVQCQLNQSFYADDLSHFVYIRNEIDHSVQVSEVLAFIESDAPQTKIDQHDKLYAYSPTRNFKIDIITGDIPNYKEIYHIPAEANEELTFTIENNYLRRNHICIIDIINKQEFKRPVYFVSESAVKELGLGDYMQQEGIVYKLMPYECEEKINIEVQYQILMERIADPLPPAKTGSFRRQSIGMLQLYYAMLADELVRQQQPEKAKNVLQYISDQLEYSIITPKYLYTMIAETWFLIDNQDKGLWYLTECYNTYFEDIPNEFDLNEKQYIAWRIQTLLEQYSPDNPMIIKLQEEMEKLQKQAKAE